MRLRRPSESVESVDVDVTPIMNLFVILIPFLVSMAVFTHYSTLQFTLPPVAGMDTGGPKKVDLKLTVVIREAELELTLGERSLSKTELQNSMWVENFKKSLREARESIKNKDGVVVSVDDDIQFEQIVSVMDYCRESGFAKISIAEGVQRDEV